MIDEELKAALVSSWPPGTEDGIDWEGPPGAHIGAVAKVLNASGVAVVDELQLASNPLTAPLWRIVDWERAFGLSSTRTARFGSLEPRRAQVISRWREYGPPTVSMIQSVVAPLLGYSNPTDLVVLQPDRADLRSKHSYAIGPLGSGSFGVSSPLEVLFYVRDDAALSPAGAQVDLTLTHPDLEQVQLTIYTPSGDSAAIPAGEVGRGAASSASLRAYFAALRTPSVWGLWRLRLESLDGTGSLAAASLFAEGFGRDGARNDGLAAAAFGWAAVYEPLKSSSAPDFDAARAAILRISYASRGGALVFIADASAGLATGDYGCIPNDNATPGAFVPGAP